MSCRALHAWDGPKAKQEGFPLEELRPQGPRAFLKLLLPNSMFLEKRGVLGQAAQPSFLQGNLLTLRSLSGASRGQPRYPPHNTPSGTLG